MVPGTDGKSLDLRRMEIGERPVYPQFSLTPHIIHLTVFFEAVLTLATYA